MIKKITVLVLLIILCFAPNVLANDGGARPDSRRVSFEFDLISEDVQIGEPFEFTMTVTNNTSKDAELLSFFSIFYESSATDNADIDEIIIDPYSTKVLDISYIVPTGINWYEKNGEYYVDFNPEMYYYAKEVKDGTEHKYKYYDEDDDYWDYYQEFDINIPLKITNLKDGRNLAEIKIIDDKSIIGFNDSAYKESASWNGELVCRHVSYLTIDNLCDKPMENLSVYQYYYSDRVINETLAAGETLTFRHVYRDYLLKKDIPKKIDMNFRAIFLQSGQYYCTYVNREYTTKVYDVPDINVVIKRVWTYDKTSDRLMPRYVFTFENIDSKTYENFFIMYLEDDTSTKESYNKYKEQMLTGDFTPNDVWEYPIAFNPEDEKDIHFILGIEEDNNFYYRLLSKYIYGLYEKNIDEYEYVFSDSNSMRAQLIKDVYYISNDVALNFPTPETTPNPTVSQSPTSMPTQTPNPTPTIQPTEKSMQEILSAIAVEEKNTCYIPTWVWIALISASVIVVILVFLITIAGNVKE